MTDIEDLGALLQRYARAADARDLDGLRALFHPDAIIEGARGRQSLEEWLAAMAGPRAYPTSMHVIGAPLAAVDGDTAELDTYAVVYQVADRDAGQADLTLGIRYLDTAARQGDGWVIRARRAKTIWTR